MDPTADPLDQQFCQVHERLSCSLSCPIWLSSLFVYDTELLSFVKSAVEELGMHCTFIASQVAATNPRYDFTYDENLRNSYPFPERLQSYVLGPPSFQFIAKRQRVVIKKIDRDDDDVILALMAIFKKRVLDGAFPKFDPNLELVILCALLSKSSDVLSEVLSTRAHLLPNCLKTALLERALFFRDADVFVEGVGELLKFGAPPGEYCHLRLLTRQYWQKSIASCKLLIEHGADLRIRSPYHSASALHHLAQVALVDQNVAVALVEAAPKSALLESITNEVPIEEIFPPVNQQEMYRRGQAKYLHFSSAMTTAFYYAITAFTRQRLDNAAVLLGYAVLPLLRAGAICDPDPGEPHILRDIVWRLLGYVGFCYALEMRQKTSFDFSKFQHVDDFYLLSSEDVDSMTAFSAAIRRSYPRPLQALCRVLILSRLPLGAKERGAAIETFDLPRPVAGYLKFSDLEGMLINLNQ